MKLVIAEKPSVGRTIAAFLCATDKKDGYMEGNGYIVSWCIGHLVGTAMPDAYGEQYKNWSLDTLPIIPTPWKYEINSATKEQFQIVKSLMERSDVDSVVCATDAGREGELIFRLVYNKAGCKKPILRLWVSSLEESDLRKGFENLRPSGEYDNLYAAAVCRQKADWLVGINMTRLYTETFKQRKPLNIGRVLTPTLALVSEREKNIGAFVPKPFWTVTLTTQDGLELVSRRFDSKAEAEALMNSCKAAVIKSVEQQEKRENPPKLFDTANLLRSANKLLGFTAQQTQDCLQNLYEKQVLTYPRTDSRYLNASMTESTETLLSSLPTVFSFLAETPLNVPQIVNDAKVSDHHALIPTTVFSEKLGDSLSSGELSIVQLVCAQSYCAAGQPQVYRQTQITAEAAGESFTASGKTVLDKGWRKNWDSFLNTLKDIEREKEEKSLPQVTQGQEISVTAAMKEGKTSPPEHFTEDSLLGAMATAGAKETSDDAERKGLGSPALRAQILENLIRIGMCERKAVGKKKVHFVPTDKGTALISVVEEQIKSPLLTADWENKLVQVKNGELSDTEFMADIEQFVRKVVADLRASEPTAEQKQLFPSEVVVVGKCPMCGRDVIEIKKGYICSAGKEVCKWAIWKEGKFFASKKKVPTTAFVTELLAKGKAPLKGCHSDKSDNKYDCTVILKGMEGDFVKFDMEFPKKAGKGAKK